MTNKYEITIDGEFNIYTEKEMVRKSKELFEDVLENEKQYIKDEEVETTEQLEEMLEMDIRDIYDIEENQEVLFGRNIIEGEIVEFNYYLTDLLEDNDYNYDRSTMSKSTYVEINEEVIRIADHSTPNITNDYGHKTPSTNLIYRNGIIDNKDLKEHFNIDIEGIIIL